jgi:hypothetical protein
MRMSISFSTKTVLHGVPLVSYFKNWVKNQNKDFTLESCHNSTNRQIFQYRPSLDYARLDLCNVVPQPTTLQRAPGRVEGTR